MAHRKLSVKGSKETYTGRIVGGVIELGRHITGGYSITNRLGNGAGYSLHQ
jgi:hypothetical protein